MKTIAIVAFALFLTSVNAVAHDGIVDINSVMSDPRSFNGRTISVQCYIFGANDIYFAYDSPEFVDEENRNGIDIVEEPEMKFLLDVVGNGGACGVVTGKFVSFTDGVIGLGNFRSNFGYIVAKSFKKTPCVEM